MSQVFQMHFQAQLRFGRSICLRAQLSIGFAPYLMRTDSYVCAEPVRQFIVDALPVKVFADRPTLAQFAANEVHAHLHDTIAAQGSAAAILATGNSQIEFLQKLVAM